MTEEAIDKEDTIKVYVYPDGEIYQIPPEWKSDDYIVRYAGFCDKCDQYIVPDYDAPFAHCECGTQEWYK